MRAFLGINNMSINKLSIIESYCECGQLIGKTRALEMLWLDRDLKTFYKISLFRTTQKVRGILFQTMIFKALTSIWRNSKVDQA